MLKGLWNVVKVAVFTASLLGTGLAVCWGYLMINEPDYMRGIIYVLHGPKFPYHEE